MRSQCQEYCGFTPLSAMTVSCTPTVEFRRCAAGNHLHCDAGVQRWRKEPVPSGIEPHLGQGDLHQPWVRFERSVGPHVLAEPLQVPQGTSNLSHFVFSCIRIWQLHPYISAVSKHCKRRRLLPGSAQQPLAATQFNFTTSTARQLPCSHRPPCHHHS